MVKKRAASITFDNAGETDLAEIQQLLRLCDLPADATLVLRKPDYPL